MSITNDNFKRTKKDLKQKYYVAVKKNTLERQSIDSGFKEANAKAITTYSVDKKHAKKRDSGLIDRKTWNTQQISLYDNNKANGTPDTYTVFFEADKSHKEAQYLHMAFFEFADLKTAIMVFESIRDSNLNIIFSPSTVNHVVGRKSKVIIDE